jgi:hypothetical protein
VNVSFTRGLARRDAAAMVYRRSRMLERAMRSIFLAGAFAASTAACAPAGPPAIAAETTASNQTAGIGATARVGGIAITPLAVLEDSRCPRDVTCVWAGRVLIRARIEADGRSSEAEMEQGKPISAAGREDVVLASVSPERTSSAAIEMDEYRFTFAPAE